MLCVPLYTITGQQITAPAKVAQYGNLLTLTGHLLFPIRPLQDNLARSANS